MLTFCKGVFYMLAFFSIIFLASLFGIWYFWKKKPNKRFLIITSVIAMISFLTVGNLGETNKNTNSHSARESSITKKESNSKAKKASESLARAKSESKAKASSLAKEKSESIAQESSAKEASESLARAESESIATAESARLASESSARAESEKAQQESIAAAQAAEQTTQTNNGNSDHPAPVNNGDLNTADANAQGVIVGNANSMIYHVPGQRGYRMNSANAVYFNSEAEAQAAGYRKSLR